MTTLDITYQQKSIQYTCTQRTAQEFVPQNAFIPRITHSGIRTNTLLYKRLSEQCAMTGHIHAVKHLFSSRVKAKEEDTRAPLANSVDHRLSIPLSETTPAVISDAFISDTIRIM